MKRYKEAGYHVYLTKDTLRGIMLEKARHPGLECIIQMPGVRIGNDFFFDMVADSGISATYEYAMCEKDHIYADHLSTRLAEYYDFPPEHLTVSQVHYHPPQYRRFSHGDGPANIKLAKQFRGVVNGLMWVDPEFHMQFWYIDEEGYETPIEYTVDDEAVAEAMPRKSLAKLKKMIEDNESGVIIRRVRSSDRRNNGRISNLYKKSVKEKERKEMSDMMNNRREKNNNASMPVECEMNFESIRESLRPYTIFLPEEYKTECFKGLLNGYYISETKTFNVVTDNLVNARNDTRVIGEAGNAEGGQIDISSGEPFVRVEWTDNEPRVTVQNDPAAEVIVDYYCFQKEVFSRNTGILEYSQMTDKQAVIPGMGSGGFFLGLELVKAGIGSLVVADNDIFAYHNICRHVCGIHDVGRYKVDIFKERAADINPNCKVYTFCDLLQHVDPKALEEVLWKKSIILCCTDNRHAGYFCNEMADKYHIPMIDAGCGVRASTGEVFYYKPDSGMACYTCAYGEDTGVDHSNQNVRRRFYATEAELEKLHFQPGMSLDIELTVIFQAKLAIDLLMEGESGYEPKLLPYINQCTILLNYPVDKNINPYMQLFESGNQKIRPMIWKSGLAEKNPKCSYCRAK